MHIVLANNVYPPIAAGGAELIVAYLGEELVRRGHEVTVVSTCGPEAEPYPDEVREGVRVVRFFPPNLYWSYTRQPRPAWKSALWHLRDAWNRAAASRFAAILAERPADVLHTHLIDGFSAAIWRRARRSGAAVVHTAHDYHLICPRAILLTRDLKVCESPRLACRAYAQWHLATARQVDVFTAPSQFLLDRHVAAGLSARSMRRVPNGIPLPAPAAPRADTDGPLKLVFAARLVAEKGVQVVLDAMRRLPARCRVELHLAGRGPLEPRVTEAAAANPAIRYHGYVSGDAKHALLSQADAMLLPSLWFENAPVVIVEAAAYGLGVIGSRLGAIPEFIAEGRNGLLFEAGSADDLARAIVRLHDDRALRATFAAEGRRWAEGFSVGAMADRYLEIYREVVGPHGRRAGEPRRGAALQGAEVSS